MNFLERGGSLGTGEEVKQLLLIFKWFHDISRFLDKSE